MISFIMEHFIWPDSNTAEDDDDEEYSIETRCPIMGYLRMFIETGMLSKCLHHMLYMQQYPDIFLHKLRCGLANCKSFNVT